MLLALKRHPLPVEAFFEYSLVLTFALDAPELEPLLPPGLELDCYQGSGFLAIALVQTKALRPRGLPEVLGQDFFLSGYRLFVRFRPTPKRVLRGLYVLRSDADSPALVRVGNLLTHYRYRLARVHTRRTADELELRVHTDGAEAELELLAQLASTPSRPPPGSPFPDLVTARRYSGPLPYTFDYEAATHGIVVVKGVRRAWQPRPIDVEVRRASYLERRFPRARLANAFLVERVPYRWKRGRLVRLGEGAG